MASRDMYWTQLKPSTLHVIGPPSFPFGLCPAKSHRPVALRVDTLPVPCLRSLLLALTGVRNVYLRHPKRRRRLRLPIASQATSTQFPPPPVVSRPYPRPTPDVPSSHLDHPVVASVAQLSLASFHLVTSSSICRRAVPRQSIPPTARTHRASRSTDAAAALRHSSLH